MPTHTRPDQVPLAVWQLAAEGPTSPDHSPRRRLADLVVEHYSEHGGVVIDLAPLGGDVARAAVLPPESALRHGRPFTPSARAVEEAARHAAGLLRPNGTFVVGLVGSEEGEDSVGQAAEAAGRAGLGYIQHVVALLGTGLDHCSSFRARRVAHADVLVFAKGRT